MIDTSSRDAFVAAHQDEWIENGQRYATHREAEGISLTDLAKYSGFSRSTLKNFEEGMPVRTRKVLERSYINCIRWRQVCRAVGNTGE